MTDNSTAHAVYCHAAIIRRVQLSLNGTCDEIGSGELTQQNPETYTLLSEASLHLDKALNCCARAHLLELLLGGVE